MMCYSSDSDRDSTATQPAQISIQNAYNAPDAYNDAYRLGGMGDNSLRAANTIIASAITRANVVPTLPRAQNPVEYRSAYYQNNREARSDYHSRGCRSIWCMWICCPCGFLEHGGCMKDGETYCNECINTRTYCEERCSNCKETYVDCCCPPFCCTCCEETE